MAKVLRLQVHVTVIVGSRSNQCSEWQEALERKGLKVNADKTETMVCARTAESLQITDKNGKALKKQVENFKYLR